MSIPIKAIIPREARTDPSIFIKENELSTLYIEILDFANLKYFFIY